MLFVKSGRDSRTPRYHPTNPVFDVDDENDSEGEAEKRGFENLEAAPLGFFSR